MSKKCVCSVCQTSNIVYDEENKGVDFHHILNNDSLPLCEGIGFIPETIYEELLDNKKKGISLIL
jgi:plastocyanin domain-containing protein